MGISAGDEHVIDDNGTKKFKLEYAIGNFDPEEISVKTEGHTLRVHALRDKNDGGNKEHKEFKRDSTIPGKERIDKARLFAVYFTWVNM